MVQSIYIKRHEEKDGFVWYSFAISPAVELINFTLSGLLFDLKKYGIDPKINLN